MLAETMRYLFLLFTPRNYLSLDEWVLNTEVHPLRINAPAPHLRGDQRDV